MEEADAAAEALPSCESSSPPGCKFELTDDDLVLHYLRPHLRGFRPLVDGVVLDDNPYRAAPWNLLLRNGRVEEGFFFVARDVKHRKDRKPMVRRTVGDFGVWKRKKCKTGTSITYFGGIVRWCQSKLIFYIPCEQTLRSSGWVMWEYEITNPECYRRADDEEEGVYWVLCHVKMSKHRTRAREDAPAEARSPTAEGLAWVADEVKPVVDVAKTAVPEGHDDGSEAGDAEESCDVV